MKTIFKYFNCLHYLLVASLLFFSACKDKEDDPVPPAVPNITTLRTVALSGDNEVPSSGSAATGTFTGSYDMDTKVLSYTITYSGISPSAMHFHNGRMGTNGAVEFTLTTPSSSPASGTTTAFTAQQESDLLAGNLYLNIHSLAYPAGDVRAQVLTSNHEVIMAELSGDYEVPASGSAGTGNFWGVYNKDTKTLNYALDYTVAVPISMHIHDGEAGTNGGVAFTLTTPVSSPVTGTTAAFTPTQESNLLAGKMYLNIHSSMHAGGELRGQLTPENIMVFNNILLSGANEVPASGSSATGVFYGTYNQSTKSMSYHLTYTGMTPTSAHLHLGAAGVNGGVEFTLTTPAASAGSGTLSGFTAAQEQSLEDGELYLNIHSTAHASGEVRGQLIP